MTEEKKEAGITQQLNRPFEGIRVLEFTTAVAGPLVGKLLADYGATVIVVETESTLRKRGSAREPGDPKKGSTLNLGYLFNKCATNKMSVTLNLKQPKGRELARKLIEKTDIIIDNYPPRVLEKWGFTYEEVSKIKEDVIMLRFPTVSTEGVYKSQNSTSWNVLAMAGLNAMTGFPGTIPISACRYSIPDESSTPFHAAAALVAALYWRGKTGKGQYIELSIYEGALAVAGLGLLEYMSNTELPERMGNRLETAVPHGVYRCLGDDRWCAIVVSSDEEWTGFCRATGMDSLLADRRFLSFADRRRHEDDLNLIIEEWTSSRRAEEVMELLQAAGVTAGVVENADDLLNWDPQLRDRNFWVTTSHPEAERLVGASWGFRLSDVQPLRGRPPLLGEHNDYVLGDLLGLSAEDINQYIIEEVIY